MSYFTIDQQIARHFVHYSECLYQSSFFSKSINRRMCLKEFYYHSFVVKSLLSVYISYGYLSVYISYGYLSVYISWRVPDAYLSILCISITYGSVPPQSIYPGGYLMPIYLFYLSLLPMVLSLHSLLSVTKSSTSSILNR